MKAFGVSLVLVAGLLHWYFFSWAGGSPHPRGYEAAALGQTGAFLVGIILPVLLTGAGVGMATRRVRTRGPNGSSP